MKKLSLILMLPLLLFSISLDVSIDSIKKHRNGELLVVVCSDKVEFPCKKTTAILSTKQKISSENMDFHFDIPNGTYAIAVLHDENANEKLDKNFLGIPKEGYALSRNEASPDFEKAKVTLQKETKINLKMRY